jgi:branched-chain amino acid transport system substrate-binding protein
VTEVVKDAQGNLFNKVHSKVDNVNQLLGMTKAEFKIGSRDVPACP